MTKKTAYDLVRELEAAEVTIESDPDPQDGPPETWQEPMFNVRLDAGTKAIVSKVERTWRIRVTLSQSDYRTDEDNGRIRKILDLADENGVEVILENAGIVLS